MSLVKSGTSWLRQSVAWSNSWASWRERLILATFFACAVGLGYLSAAIQLWQAAVLWAGYLAALAVCSRQGWLQLFGPVLIYDMIRTARRSRYTIMRMMYAGLLLFVLCFLYLSIAANHRFDPSSFFFHVAGLLVFLLLQMAMVTALRFVTAPPGRYLLLGVVAVTLFIFFGYIIYLAVSDERRMNPRETAMLAESYFGVFMIVQLVMVTLLTPAYVAGSIADEKDRKTLEFMLATDLNNHEIILSKLLSRLANIVLFLLTGLPILSILQFMGGVDGQLMLMGFAGTGLTMLGIASVSILFSTLLQKPRDAIGLTYLFIIAYGSLATLGKALVLAGAPLMSRAIWFGEDAPTLADASQVLNTGNPIAAIIVVTQAIQTASLAATLPDLLTNYAYFHGILALVCIVWSIVRLRAIALKQTVGGKTQKRSAWDSHRPPIGELPMIWKELHIEGRMKLNWLGWGIIIVLVLLTVGSGLFIVGVCFWEVLFEGRADWRMLPEATNAWFRIAGTGVAGLMILMVAVRASTCITNERERDTFDALLTTPMSGEAMLSAKLLGCLTSVRMGWLWFGAMLALGLFTGGIHLLAVPIVIVAWFIYAIFFAMVGIWFSLVCKSSMRATVLTVLTTLFLGGGHWVFTGLCCYMPAAALIRGGHSGDFLEYVAKFQLGMTPPFVVGFCSYSWENLARDFRSRDFGAEMIVFCLIGLFLWAMGSLILWYGILLPKFRDITRREELIYQ